MEFLTKKDLVKVLKCSLPAVNLWRREGLPARRFGRLVRFELPAVLAWFEQRDAQKQAKREREGAECANLN